MPNLYAALSGSPATPGVQQPTVGAPPSGGSAPAAQDEISLMAQKYGWDPQTEATIRSNKASLPPQPSIHKALVTPYQNYANKATGKDSN